MRARPGSFISRRAASVGPAFLYFVIAIAMLSPFWPRRFRQAGDLNTVLGTIVEADHALIEGQFPIRVAPQQHAFESKLKNGTRYPFFQFYGNFPFTLGGIVYHFLPAPNPYLAWKLTTVLALTAGGLYTWRLCRRLTRRNAASIVAGAAFMTSPYMFADLIGRGSFTELVAFNLLPAVLFYAWRTFVSPGWGHICRSSIAWALLGLSHNISYLYAVIFIGIWFLLFATPHARYAKRLGRVVLAGILQGVLVLWYLWPQVTLMNDLMIGGGGALPDPYSWRFLTTLHSLLWPYAYTVKMQQAVTPYLTTQVGVPVMVGIVLAIAAVFMPRKSWKQRAMALRAAVLCFAAFIVVWAPIDFWRHLPDMLRFVQFPYRLLMFVVLFGSIALACGLAWMLAMRTWRQSALSLLIIAGCCVSYVIQPGPYESPAVVAAGKSIVDEMAVRPYISGQDDYLPSTAATARTSIRTAGINYVGRQFGLPQDGWLTSHIAVSLPAPESADALLVEGFLDAQHASRARLGLQVGDNVKWSTLESGPFSIRVAIPEPLYERSLTLSISPRTLDESGNMIVHVDRVAFTPDAPRHGQRATVGLAETGKLVELGPLTTCDFAVTQPSVVIFPVLYYPGLLSVWLDGKSFEPGNVGRYLALKVDPGPHAVRVAFTGMRWANAASFAGWVMVLTMLLVRRRTPVRIVIVGLLVLAAGVAVAEGFPRVAQHYADRERTTYKLKVTGDPNHPPKFAFDGDPSTAWLAPPRSRPTLTIRPGANHHRLSGITFVSRETGLFESWQSVHVVLRRRGSVVLDRAVKFDDADRVAAHTIRFEALRTDEIELSFSEPVLRTKEGKLVDEAAVSPGYSEIRLEDDGETETAAGAK